MPPPEATTAVPRPAPLPSRRVAVGISGGGRSLGNMLAEAARGRRQYEVAAVVASKADCGGVEIAKKAGLPVYVGSFPAHGKGESPEATTLYRWLADHDVGWIALAGFLRPWPLHPAWHGRIVNIHPALLPAFGGRGMYGDRVHAAVIAAGARETGASVHFVTERYDEGGILGQVRVPVEPGDDVKRLAARVFAAECALYPAVLDRLVTASQDLPWHGGPPWQCEWHP